LVITTSKSVLVVAAHPDDEVLGCGGTIARHADAGDQVNVLIVAEGATSRQHPSAQPHTATPIATTPARHLPQSFFCRPAEVVAPELIGCLLVKRQANGELLWGVIVETEAYSQDDPACHGYRRRTPSNETLFGEPGRFYVVVSYGIHHCVNVVA